MHVHMHSISMHTHALYLHISRCTCIHTPTHQDMKNEKYTTRMKNQGKKIKCNLTQKYRICIICNCILDVEFSVAS